MILPSSEQFPVERPSVLSTLNALPQELLINIFNCLPIQDRYIVAQVCSRWRRLIQLITKKLFLTLDKYDYEPTFRNESFFTYDIHSALDHKKEAIKVLKLFGQRLKKLKVFMLPIALYFTNENDFSRAIMDTDYEFIPWAATPDTSLWFKNLLQVCPDLTSINLLDCVFF